MYITYVQHFILNVCVCFFLFFFAFLFVLRVVLDGVIITDRASCRERPHRNQAATVVVPAHLFVSKA